LKGLNFATLYFCFVVICVCKQIFVLKWVLLFSCNIVVLMTVTVSAWGRNFVSNILFGFIS